MWVLTKMAMIFFIASLAAILVIFGGYERVGLCNKEAMAISARVASGITQIFNTPVEDERRVIQLEPSLALGERARSRYSIALTKRDIAGKDFNAVIVSVVSEADPRCSAGVQVTYSDSLDTPAADPRLKLLGAREPTSPQTGFKRFAKPVNDPKDVNAKERMVIKPSAISEEREGSRSTYLTLLKCTEKKVTRATYFFVQDCTQQDSNNCINLDSGEVTPKCGFR